MKKTVLFLVLIVSSFLFIVSASNQVYAVEKLYILRVDGFNSTIISDPPGINCGSNCVAAFEKDTAVNLLIGNTCPTLKILHWLALQRDGNLFDSWTRWCPFGGRLFQSAFDSFSQPVNVILSDYFQTYPGMEGFITTAVYPYNSGSITGTGIVCPANCVASFPNNAVMTLTANAAQGHQFDHWVGCDVPNSNQCTMRAGGPGKTFPAVIAVFNPVIVTDTTWRASNTGSEGWNSLSFDDSAWANAVQQSVYLVDWLLPADRIPATTGIYLWGGQDTYENSSDVYLRKTFTVSRVPASAVIRISADDNYDLFINGISLGTDPYGGWSAGPAFREYDVTDKILLGNNVIAVHGINYQGPAFVLAELKMSNVDSVAPVTTPSFSGNPGANGWYTSDIRVSLAAFDSGSGVDKTDYSLNGLSWNAYTSPIFVTSEGATTIYYRSTDKAGNIEAAKNITVKIDKSSPVVSISATPNILWPPNNKMVNVKIDGAASDAMSGMRSVQITVSDEYGQYNMNVPGFGSTIQLQASRNGSDKDGRVYTITAVATDNAGNQSSATTTVIVHTIKANKRAL